MRNFATVAAISLLACGCTTVPAAPAAEPAPAPAAAAQPLDRPALGGLQFLYGSGEGAAVSRQVYRGLETYALARAANRPHDSVILADDATLDAPTFVPCGDKPLAVVFDVDETVILNVGLEYAQYTGTRGALSDQLPIRPVPGAPESIRAMQRAGITPIYNTNRTVDMADLVAGYIASIGLDRPVMGETLFLNGMDEMRGNKDGRRATIARSWCVIAMAGDQLGDFTEMLNTVTPVSARRAAALAEPIASKWGNGWFMLPNTAYGRALAGDLSEVFPEIEPPQD